MVFFRCSVDLSGCFAYFLGMWAVSILSIILFWGLVSSPVSCCCFLVPFGVPVGVDGIVGKLGFPAVCCLGEVAVRTICSRVKFFIFGIIINEA